MAGALCVLVSVSWFLVERELVNFDDELARRERWLVLTKTDQLAADEAHRIVEDVIKRLDWQAPWFAISSVARRGLESLTGRIMVRLEERRAEADDTRAAAGNDVGPDPEADHQ